jgi:hypothetical protein
MLKNKVSKTCQKSTTPFPTVYSARNGKRDRSFEHIVFDIVIMTLDYANSDGLHK